MNGTELGKSLNRLDAGEHLGDAEMKYLRDGLKALVEFFSVTKVQPMLSYYSLQLYAVEQYLWNREFA